MERIRLVAQGDIFEISRKFRNPCIVVPTNRQLKSDGKLVMGGGLAKAAKIHAEKYDIDISKVWGKEIEKAFPYHKPIIIHQNLSFMGVHTKVHWKDPSTFQLVSHAMNNIGIEAEVFEGVQFLIPLLGAGLGGLNTQTITEYITARISHNMVLVIPNDS